MTVIVVVYRCAPGRRGSRGQRWRWKARSAGNNEVLAVASEAYANERDCLHAVDLLFSDETRVVRRHPVQPEVVLREVAG